MDPSTPQSVAGALVLAVLLAVLHLAAPRIRTLPFVPDRATASFGGGLAVASVFSQLLPEVAEGNQAVGEALLQVVDPTPLLELGIFLVALAAFRQELPTARRSASRRSWRDWWSTRDC